MTEIRREKTLDSLMHLYHQELTDDCDVVALLNIWQVRTGRLLYKIWVLFQI